MGIKKRNTHIPRNGKSIYRVRKWRHTLDQLKEETGISFEEVCKYAGITYNENGVSFYAKLPKRRTTFIGIGMAYHQSLEVINDWIMYYGGKRKLYAKDISEDLVWIYLIHANEQDKESGKNYYQLYDECQSMAYALWESMWTELIRGAEKTATVESELDQVDFDCDFNGLRTFIIDHMDSFKTAYSKPRKYLDQYVDLIITTCRRYENKTRIRGLSDLRGWLDDSMINYLSGDSETINVTDAKSREVTMRIKQIPKNKRTHIALCLSLGMAKHEVNHYLKLMGFAPLSDEIPQEAQLITVLSAWEMQHPLPARYKELYFYGKPSGELTQREELLAVEEMLMLRQDLSCEYEKLGLDFPYLKQHRLAEAEE